MFTKIKQVSLGFMREKESEALIQARALVQEDLQECQRDMRKNEMCFNLELDPDLLEQYIYERQALACRHRYLIERARALGLRVGVSVHEKTW